MEINMRNLEGLPVLFVDEWNDPYFKTITPAYLEAKYMKQHEK